MRICLVYDCLYPYTVGGGERWYRNLAEGLARRGHEVTYVTLRQWERGATPTVAGLTVEAVAPGSPLYAGGRRRIGLQVRFAAAVFAYLLRRGGDFDVVQTPGLHLSVLAAIAARRLRGFTLVVDWFEVWTRDYWLQYLGRVAGRLGWTGQRLAARSRHRALCFSRLHARRLAEQGHAGEITVVEGLYAGGAAAEPEPAEPVVVFAGRHIPEKRVTALPPALALARERVPGLRAAVYGDGPDRPELLRLAEELGLGNVLEAPGFVDGDRVEQSVRRALCLLLPSEREGYGLVVVEASAAGTPSIVVRAPDNAAVELVADGENGVVAPSAEPSDLADAVARVHEAGPSLRRSTVEWFARNRERLSVESSVDVVLGVYRR